MSDDAAPPPDLPVDPALTPLPADAPVPEPGHGTGRWRALAHLLTVPLAFAAMTGTVIGVALWFEVSLAELQQLLERPLPFQDPPAGARPDDRITWLNALLAIALFLTAGPLSSAVERSLKALIPRRAKIDEGLEYSVIRVSGYFVWSLAIYSALLQIFRLEGLGYVVAALSVGIGFGLQEVISNFVCGIILLFERPFRVGDTVVIGEHEGYVRKISMRATTIHTFDNVAILVPNKDLITQRVVNVRHIDPKVRAHVRVGVSYASDVEAVRAALLDVARVHPRVLGDPEPRVLFTDFGDSTLDFDLMVWMPEPDDRRTVPSELRFAILKRFRECGIEIAFPQRDLHIRSGGWPPPGSP